MNREHDLDRRNDPELEANDELALELDRRGAGERQRIVHDAQGVASYPGQERAEATLQRLMGASASEERQRARFAPIQLASIPKILVVAAAILLVVFAARAFLFDDVAPPPEDIYLGDGDVIASAPVGSVDAYGAFAWSFTLPAGGYYELSIWDASRNAEQPVILVEELNESRWIPEPQQARSLPASIRWQVLAFDATGARLAAVSVLASRSSSR